MNMSMKGQMPIKKLIFGVLIIAAGLFMYFIWGSDTVDAGHTNMIPQHDTAVESLKSRAKVEVKTLKREQTEIVQQPVAQIDYTREHELEGLRRQQLDARRRAPVVVYSAGKTANNPSTVNTSAVKAENIEHLEYKLIQGKTLSGILETAIHSDLPGMVRAIVNENVYGEQGSIVIIPKGSRLVGQYSAQTELGQSRLFVTWQRVVRPDGISIQLDSPGTDAIGRAGLTGRVNTHFKERFGNAVLLSLIAAGTSNINVGKKDEYNSQSAYRQAVSNSFNESASESLEKNYQIGPTVEVKQGTRIQVLVAKDLNFYEALQKTL